MMTASFGFEKKSRQKQMNHGKMHEMRGVELWNNGKENQTRQLDKIDQ
jgi:hypothetical protein